MIRKFIQTYLTKGLLLLLGLTVTVATIQTLRVRWGHKRETALSEALTDAERHLRIASKALTTAADAIGLRDRLVVEARKENYERRTKIEKALAANTAWSFSPVPPAVIDGLHSENEGYTDPAPGSITIPLSGDPSGDPDQSGPR